MLYGLLAPYGERCIVFPIMATCLGSVARVLGALAALLSLDDRADAHFDAALRIEEHMRAQTFLTRARAEYAKMLLRRRAAGDVERAAPLLDAARATVSELGMAALGAELDS
ncbi:MAG: hypothetical protein ACREQ9_05660 [Candidatus Binatia bacterium]